MLPHAYSFRMKELLQQEYPDFIQTYSNDPALGLRVNTCKTTASILKSKVPFLGDKVPWSTLGYYYTDRPGKHPYHEAGLYYIQEPSAMAVAEILDPKEGEMILDLAAAPGGKTTHIATLMNNTGLIVANEIIPKRAKILSENVERLGFTNTIVTNASIDHLKQYLHASFDRVLLDAPCSGEGMFRKDENAMNEWSIDAVNLCSIRQDTLLHQAASFVKEGGILVYSTCTFSMEENEHIIQSFLETHPDFTVIDIPKEYGFQPGITLPQTVRLYPHHLQGEGHFIAKLQRKGNAQGTFYQKTLSHEKPPQELITFFQDNFPSVSLLNLRAFGSHWYKLPLAVPSFDKIKVLRMGLHLGEMKKNRFEPSHHLALSLDKGETFQMVDYASDSPQIRQYLSGESLPNKDKKRGWVLITIDGYPIGFGKASGSLIKNHYPKGLRIR